MAAPQKPKKHNPMEYMKYAGMAFQMGAIMFIGAYFGNWLDEKYGNETPIFLLICVIVALIAAFYVTLKDLIINKK